MQPFEVIAARGDPLQQFHLSLVSHAVNPMLTAAGAQTLLDDPDPASPRIRAEARPLPDTGRGAFGPASAV